MRVAVGCDSLVSFFCRLSLLKKLLGILGGSFEPCRMMGFDISAEIVVV